MVLRRLVYLAIKELSEIADDVIIVTSSLTKDMTGKEDNYRAPAIRALTCIVDASMVQSIERYMKQAIVDKAPAVSSGMLTEKLENNLLYTFYLYHIIVFVSVNCPLTRATVDFEAEDK